MGGLKKRGKKKDGDDADVKKSSRVLRKLASRQKDRVLDATLDDQFASGRLLLHLVAAGPERPRRRLHPRGQRARVLQEEARREEGQEALVGVCWRGVIVFRL